jgi:chorismate synthase
MKYAQIAAHMVSRVTSSAFSTCTMIATAAIAIKSVSADSTMTYIVTLVSKAGRARPKKHHQRKGDRNRRVTSPFERAVERRDQHRHQQQAEDDSLGPQVEEKGMNEEQNQD